MNTGTEILRILKDQKIKKIKDIDNYPINYHAKFQDSICGEEDMWIGDVFNIIKRDVEQSSRQLLQGEKKYITFSDDSDDILKYACMFPKTSINLKDIFDEYMWDRGDIYYTIPKNFFRSLLKHKSLVKEGIYKILPEIIKESGDSENEMQEAYTTWSLSGKQEYWQGSLVNKGVNVSGPNGIYLSNEKVEKLYFEFPWLYGVSVEDYIRIVNKNRLLYDNYCTTILKFIEEVHNGNYLSIKQEMMEANNSIKIELEKAQNSLRRKGIQTLVSIAFTFIPMALSLPEEQKTLLSTFLGASSLKDIYMTFSDEIAALHEVGKSSPFWLMYQWQKKVKI